MQIKGRASCEGQLLVRLTSMRFGKAHIRPRCYRGAGSKDDATCHFDESRDYAGEQDSVQNEKIAELPGIYCNRR